MITLIICYNHETECIFLKLNVFCFKNIYLNVLEKKKMLRVTRFEKLHELRFNAIFVQKKSSTKAIDHFTLIKNYIFLLHILHDYTYYDY